MNYNSVRKINHTGDTILFSVVVMMMLMAIFKIEPANEILLFIVLLIATGLLMSCYKVTRK